MIDFKVYSLAKVMQQAFFCQFSYTWSSLRFSWSCMSHPIALLICVCNLVLCFCTYNLFVTWGCNLCVTPTTYALVICRFVLYHLSMYLVHLQHIVHTCNLCCCSLCMFNLSSVITYNPSSYIYSLSPMPTTCTLTTCAFLAYHVCPKLVVHL
jgi:hypothetical protein